MFDTLFLQILDMSRTACFVILAVLLARLLLKRAPRILSCALWWVVLFRLLSPWAPEAPLSLLPERTPAAEAYTLADKQISPADTAQAAYQAAGDLLNGGIGIQHIRTMETDESGHPEYVSSSWWEVWVLAGQYLWLTGMALMGVYSILSYCRLRGKLVGALGLRDNIYLSDYIASPFVLGIFSPKIYLPSSLAEREREYIILHEQQHIRRLDPAVKALFFLALSIHWFNPLVWLAFILLGKDMEMSCDEAVIRKMGSGIRADYSASLLSLATGRRIIAGTPLAFGEGDPKGRIKNLARWKKPVLWTVLAGAGVCILLAVCLLTNPRQEKDSLCFIWGDSISNHYRADFALSLGEEAKSGTVYAEQWSRGECVRSSSILLTRYAAEIHIQIDLLQNEDSEGNSGSFGGINIQMNSDQYGGSLLTYFPLPEDREMIGWSFSSYLPGEEFTVCPGDSRVLAAMAFDAGQGIRVFDCETLTDEPERLHTADYMILIRADFSGEDIPPSTDEAAPFHDGTSKRALTLEDVITLSEKGEALTWADFNEYDYYETGSGLYIRAYDIDENYSLWIGGGGGAQVPLYIHLFYKPDPYAFIEVRTDDVEAFLRKYNAYIDIKELLLSMVSSPGLSSSPGDYISEHREAYDKLTAYEEIALEYCFGQFFQGEQTDLRGSIMAILCRDIAENLGEDPEPQGKTYATGQEWFDAFRERAGKLRAECSDAQMEESWPASRILLDMIERLPTQ